MKKLFFSLLIMSTLLWSACDKEEPTTVGYSFTFVNNSFRFSNDNSRSFIMLFDEAGNLIKDEEIKEENEITLTAEKQGNYTIGYFSKNTGFDGNNYFTYNVFHNIPNGTKSSLNTYYANLNSFKDANIIIENLSSFDSLYVSEQSFLGLPKTPQYDAATKTLSYKTNILFEDMGYCYVRPHKDSAFRYQLIPALPTGIATPIIRLDYNKLQKAATIATPLFYNITDCVAETNIGRFILMNRNGDYYSKGPNALIVPSEKINTYYTSGGKYDFSSGSSYVVFDKVSHLNELSAPNLIKLEVLPQPNGENEYKFVGGTPTAIEFRSYQEVGNERISFSEMLPVSKANFKETTTKLPQVMLNYFPQLKQLKSTWKEVELHSFKNEKVEYDEFINYYTKIRLGEFDEWRYKKGLVISH